MLKIRLKPRVNSANKQINFQLKKNILPKEFKDRLPKLRGLKLDLEDFEFDD